MLGNFEKILKIFDQKSIEKYNFYFILEDLLLKIEPSEITPFFYHNFFGFVGRNFFSSPPGHALDTREIIWNFNFDQNLEFKSNSTATLWPSGAGSSFPCSPRRSARGPNTVAATRAKDPPSACTALLPAKSYYGRFEFNGCHRNAEEEWRWEKFGKKL